MKGSYKMDSRNNQFNGFNGLANWFDQQNRMEANGQQDVAAGYQNEDSPAIYISGYVTDAAGQQNGYVGAVTAQLNVYNAYGAGPQWSRR